MPYTRDNIKIWNFTSHPLSFGENSKKPSFTVERDDTWYIRWLKKDLLDYHFVGNTRIEAFYQVPVATDNLLLRAQRVIEIAEAESDIFHMIYVSFPTAVALAKVGLSSGPNWIIGTVAKHYRSGKVARPFAIIQYPNN